MPVKIEPAQAKEYIEQIRSMLPTPEVFPIEPRYLQYTNLSVADYTGNFGSKPIIENGMYMWTLAGGLNHCFFMKQIGNKWVTLLVRSFPAFVLNKRKSEEIMLEFLQRIQTGWHTDPTLSFVCSPYDPKLVDGSIIDYERRYGATTSMNKVLCWKLKDIDGNISKLLFVWDEGTTRVEACVPCVSSETDPPLMDKLTQRFIEKVTTFASESGWNKHIIFDMNKMTNFEVRQSWIMKDYMDKFGSSNCSDDIGETENDSTIAFWLKPDYQIIVADMGDVRVSAMVPYTQVKNPTMNDEPNSETGNKPPVTATQAVVVVLTLMVILFLASAVSRGWIVWPFGHK